MSNKPKLGGTVRISYKNYAVTAAPEKRDNCYLLGVKDPESGDTFIAQSELWRGGCGPWRIAYQVGPASLPQPSNG